MKERCEKMRACCEKMRRCLEKGAWLAPLVARVTVGWIFVESGWGKLHNLPKVIEFFGELGIPAPAIQAPFVAGVELVGGALVLVGLLTRIASPLLLATMAVALITAKREEIHSLSDLFGMSEYLYAVIFLWLTLHGPGKASVDARLCCDKA